MPQFSVPYTGHFVDDKQSHCRPVVRYSQSENTARINREEFTRDTSVSTDSCNLGNQSENALTKAIHSLTGVIATFQNLVSDMRYGDNAWCKQIGTGLPHVFVVLSK